MKNNKVLTVFDGMNMQKYFLLVTKQAEEVVYNQFKESFNNNISMDEFFKLVIDNNEIKELLKEMILTALSNHDWKQIMVSALNKMSIENRIQS